MTTERELHEEIKKLLKKNRELMSRAFAMAEGMIGIREDYEAMGRELENLKRTKKAGKNTDD